MRRWCLLRPRPLSPEIGGSGSSRSVLSVPSGWDWRAEPTCTVLRTSIRSGASFSPASRRPAGRLEAGSRASRAAPVSVAQASHEATSSATPNNDMIERAVADLSLRVDQVRAANDGSARDLGQGIERIHSSAEQNHRELVAKLVQLTERVERIERQAAAATAAAVVSPTRRAAATAAPAKPVANRQAVHKPVAEPAAACARRKGEGGPRQTSAEDPSPVWT